MSITKDQKDKERKRFINSLNNIMKYSMDEYVNEQELSVPSDRVDLIHDLNEIIQIAPECCRKNETFLDELISKEDYNENKKFLDWLKRYVNSINKPHEHFMFLKEYSIEKFETLSLYCIENTILKVVGKETIEAAQWKYEEIARVRGAMLTTGRLMLCKNYSDNLVKSEISKMFGIDDEKIDVWLKIISENSEVLWKYLLMQRIEKIEERLNNY